MNISKLVSFLKLFVETNMRLRRFKIMDISKKDWKLFRERLSGWQGNYMEGLIKEYVNFLNDDEKPASEKFWELEKRIKEDKRHPGVILEMSKSQVLWDIVRLFLAEISAGDYNFHRWTSKPTEYYSVNSKQTCKPPELHTIMKNAMVLDWY